MSTITQFNGNEKILIEQLVEYSNGYTGNLMNSISNATTNVPVNQVKPIILPFHEFSEKNPITDEKTNIFSSIAIGFTPEQIRLFRLKYDVVVGYDDPRLNYIQAEFSNIISDMNRQFEKLLFTGIHKDYGFQRNKKTEQLTRSAANVDEFVSILSSEIEQMVIAFGPSTFSVYLPIGWYKDFPNVQGVPADQYVMTALSSRASRMGITINMYDSECVDKIYIVRNDDISGYFGIMPMMRSVINDERKEEYVYRFTFDTPAIVIGRNGAVKAIGGLTRANAFALRKSYKQTIELKNDSKYSTPEAFLEKAKYSKSKSSTESE